MWHSEGHNLAPAIKSVYVALGGSQFGTHAANHGIVRLSNSIWMAAGTYRRTFWHREGGGVNTELLTTHYYLLEDLETADMLPASVMALCLPFFPPLFWYKAMTKRIVRLSDSQCLTCPPLARWIWACIFFPAEWNSRMNPKLPIRKWLTALTLALATTLKQSSFSLCFKK